MFTLRKLMSRGSERKLYLLNFRNYVIYKSGPHVYIFGCVKYSYLAKLFLVFLFLLVQ